jgi:hypothetical protein
MRKLPLLLLLLFFLIHPFVATAQVVNFAKTLPERSFSVGLAPSYYLDLDGNNVGLRSIGVDAEQNGALAIGLSGGYGINYSLDVGAKFIYVLDGTHFFGIDFQYLAYETRFSYFSVIAGVHRWDNYGLDLTALYTYSPRYSVNLSIGLDMDLNLDPDMESGVRTRFWLPLNAGFNVTETTFVFVEYNLRVSQWAWGIASVGVNFIFR